jgi:gliding motility-associated-like protein
MLVSCFTFVQSQNNALVINGAYTVLNGGTQVAPVYLVVNQSNTQGIVRSGGGHIVSEQQYNFVKWVSGTGTGNYIFPFGVGGVAADYIPFTFNKTTATGSDIDMSTWTTNVQNIPHPTLTNVGPVTSMTGTADSVVSAIDRFWDIESSAAVTADLTFSYRGIENTTAFPTDTVKAQHWDGSAWDPQAGPGNIGVVAGVGSVGPIPNQSTFSPWVLTIIPNCPLANFSYSSPFCEGDTSAYLPSYGPSSVPGVFSSSLGLIFVDTLTGELDLVNSTPGTYTIYNTVPAIPGCQIAIDSFQIVINPIVTTPQALSICQGDSILLGGAFQNAAGVFSDTLSTSFGCDSILVTTLTIDPLNTIAADTVAQICFGDPLVLTATGSGNGTITWYSDPSGTNVIGTGSPFSPVPTGIGTFVYYVNEAGTCSSTMDSVVAVVGGVVAVINANPTSGTVPLNVSLDGTSSTGSITGYAWDFDGDGIIDDTLSMTSTIYSTTGVYTITLIVTDGVCSDTTTITIDAFGESAILIPNVITPNGDGLNDVFTVDGVNLVSVEGEIYNRWGQLMFSWNNVKGAWDGRTLSGEVVPDGTYFYIIKATGTDEQEYLKKGTFSLIR